MATYTLIPSSLTGGKSITNASRAYTNTSSTTYAEVTLNGSNTSAWLGGFDFDFVPDETIVSVTIKCKVKNSDSCYIRVYSSSDSNRVALSSTVNGASVYSDGLITFSLTSSKDVILSYLAGGTLCIAIYVSSTISYATTPQVYGAEVIVETDATPKANKVIYGGNTILDLTGDTVTRAKVLSGTTFHLPNGVQSVGAYTPPTLSKATASTTGTSTREVSFTVSKEPSWFVLICLETNTTARNARVFHMLYNGTTTTTYYAMSNMAGGVKASTGYGSFLYSGGTLTISVDTTPYFGKADWELYYL